jgi:hypothetical protein
VPNYEWYRGGVSRVLDTGAGELVAALIHGPSSGRPKDPDTLHQLVRALLKAADRCCSQLFQDPLSQIVAFAPFPAQPGDQQVRQGMVDSLVGTTPCGGLVPVLLLACQW